MLSSRVSNRLGSLRTIAVAFGLAAPFYLLNPLALSFAARAQGKYGFHEPTIYMHKNGARSKVL